MGRRTQRIVIAVVALALIVPLGAAGLTGLLGRGSSSDPQSPAAAPSDSRPRVDPASQPQPSPTQLPPAPAQLTAQTPEGAQAALTYLLDTYPYMMATGDTAPWTQLTDPNCQVCVQFLAAAAQLHQQGGWGVGGEFQVTSTAFDGTGEPPASGVATAQFRQAQQLIIDDPSREAHTEPGLSGRIEARMVWDGERWRVGDMSMTDVQRDPGGSSSDAGGAPQPAG